MATDDGASKGGLTSRWRRTRTSHRLRDKLAASAILVLGCPRSGTTWLAKIFDSHPNVLYRHEPDELILPRPGIEPVEQISDWIAQRGLRSAGKRPIFRKSWRPAPLALTRNILTYLLAGSEKLPIGTFVSRKFGLPDLILYGRQGTVRAAVKLVNWDGSMAARTMPDCRCCLILRHPCGQIASVKTGLANGQFRFLDEGGAPVDLQVTAEYAAGCGVDRMTFDALPDAAKFAWSWRAFNEPAVEGLRALPNAKIVIYEDLCRKPATVAKDLFAFAGLDWNPQTSAFINQSTSQGDDAGYYNVFRKTPMVVDQWRQTLSPADQAAVLSVVRKSPLAAYWPDILQAA